MEFARVVSLGAICQVGYQIRRRYGLTPVNPFDWIVTPFEAIGKVLQGDGSKFSRSLSIREETAVCDYYGIGYHHEFPRNNHRMPVISEATIEQCRSKLSSKYRKLITRLEDNKPTLFIRMMGHHDHGTPDHLAPDQRPLTFSQINSLAHAISMRFPNLSFQIAIVRMPAITRLIADMRLDNRVSFHSLRTFEQWSGDDVEWDGIFDKYRICPFETAGQEVASEHLYP